MKNAISQTSHCRRTLKSAWIRADWSCQEIATVAESGDGAALAAAVGRTVGDCLGCQRKASALSGSAIAIGTVVKTRRMLQSRLDGLSKNR